MGVNYKATAAQASFSNGINERHNAILKDILTKLRIDDEHRSTPVDMLLSYAIFEVFTHANNATSRTILEAICLHVTS